MQRRDLNAVDAPKPAGSYTQAVEVTGVSRTLYVSGQVPASLDGTVPATWTNNAAWPGATSWHSYVRPA